MVLHFLQPLGGVAFPVPDLARDPARLAGAIGLRGISNGTAESGTIVAGSTPFPRSACASDADISGLLLIVLDHARLLPT
jgi:hypothetical protein